MNFTKSIPLSNIPNLNTVFQEMNLFSIQVEKMYMD